MGHENDIARLADRVTKLEQHTQLPPGQVSGQGHWWFTHLCGKLEILEKRVIAMLDRIASVEEQQAKAVPFTSSRVETKFPVTIHPERKLVVETVETPPIVPWDALNEKIVCVAKDMNNEFYGYESEPEIDGIDLMWNEAPGEQVYELTDVIKIEAGTCHWTRSLVHRPGYEPEYAG